MSIDRHLDWAGSHNVRDLGGLPAAEGRETRWGAVVRSENPAFFGAAAWSALREHGIRTIVDLADLGEDGPDVTQRPPEVATVHLPLDDHEDTEFWDRWGGAISCTPLYYPAFVERFPERTATVLAAVAHAPTGGVLVHCGSGRDRTGLIVLVLLGLLGVGADDIAADHELSHERLAPLAAKHGRPDDAPKIMEYLAAHNTTTHEIVQTILSMDLTAVLRAGGLTEDNLIALDHRLLTGAT